MRPDPLLLGFLGVAALLTILPGSDTALVLKNVVQYGRRAALASILGIATGCLIHATASALGLSVVLRTSATAFTVVKLIGASYLAWIGVQTLLASRRTGALVPSDAAAGAEPRSAAPKREPDVPIAPENSVARAMYVQGLLTNLLNPKVALFYLTFLPQFIRPTDNVLARSLLLAMLHNVMGILWLGAIALGIGAIGPAVQRPRVKRWIERVTGAALVGLGVRLAWARR